MCQLVSSFSFGVDFCEIIRTSFYLKKRLKNLQKTKIPDFEKSGTVNERIM